MAANYKLYIDQGATFSRSISLKNSDGDPYDLSAASISAQIRSTATSSVKIADFTVSISSPAASGQFIMSMPASGTALLPVDPNEGPERVNSVYAYDVEMVIGSTVTRLLQGEVVVSPEVTR
jgi:hypothetical protein